MNSDHSMHSSDETRQRPRADSSAAQSRKSRPRPQRQPALASVLPLHAAMLPPAPETPPSQKRVLLDIRSPLPIPPPAPPPAPKENRLARLPLPATSKRLRMRTRGKLPPARGPRTNPHTPTSEFLDTSRQLRKMLRSGHIQIASRERRGRRRLVQPAAPPRRLSPNTTAPILLVEIQDQLPESVMPAALPAQKAPPGTQGPALYRSSSVPGSMLCPAYFRGKRRSARRSEERRVGKECRS